ncbi:MAG TPA: nucleotidyltransferase family protein [Steroidobacteraceae bacterium]|nr:nucleotidyltransferase family protein [Steroidobacteraceae bacterium]
MNVNPLCTLQIIVLAAGFSSRMGQSKPLARVHGISLLRRALIAAAGLKGPRITVVIPSKAAGYRREAHGMQVRWAVNTRRAQGLSSSVRAGIAAARHSAGILIMPADLANLKGRDLERLVHRWQASPRRLVARRIDRSGGIPLILPRWLYGRALTIEGDAGLRHLVGQLAAEQRVLVELPSAAADVDTPEDLHNVRRRYRS